MLSLVGARERFAAWAIVTSVALGFLFPFGRVGGHVRRVQASSSAVLLLWNPLHEPRAIEVHVDHLREREATWWGRIYGRPGETPLDAPSAGVQSMLDQSAAHLAPVLAGEGEATVLVTNQTSLHALRVTEVRAEHEPPSMTEVPQYYKGTRAIQWFRVVDVRALYYDQVSTLGFLRSVKFDRHVLDAARRPGEIHNYDPFASMGYRYPLPITLAAEDHATLWHRPSGVRRFVDLEEAAFPQALLQALAYLESRHEALWARLSRPAQLFLANGEVSRKALGEQSRFSVGPAVLGVAQAAEHEIADGIVRPLLDPAPARTERGSALRRAVYPDLSDEKQRKNNTLGGLMIKLGKISRALDESGLQGAFPALYRLKPESRDGSDLWTLKEARNSVAHPGRSATSDDLRTLWELAMARHEAPLLARIADARSEIAAHVGE